MSCAYHRKLKKKKAEQCSEECPMQLVFDGSNNLKWRMLKHFLGGRAGGSSVFSRFFADRSIEERFFVAESLRWVSEQWDSDPVRGPLGAYFDVQAEILNLRDRGFVVKVADDVFVPAIVDVLFHPLVDNKRKRCLFHKKAGGGVGARCDEKNCIYFPIFPPTANEAVFLSIYAKFGGKVIIPNFFEGLVDLPSRESVAASLFWEVACWLKDPIHGPKGQFDEQQLILSSLFPPELVGVEQLGLHKKDLMEKWHV